MQTGTVQSSPPPRQHEARDETRIRVTPFSRLHHHGFCVARDETRADRYRSVV
ncbi:hypothetical protein HSB1_23530 [Halogranum salarium B-1]|uniref:Uncharacterized protein n=1 Tax=Halogranum salarium B-1 TaxID=1210908 RepID=J3EVZ4_9EURY|nr:hypothetical protein HSB1_23530 [Halogranum salarium B-1]